MSGLFAMGNSGFGRVKVRGYVRVLFPATNKTACIDFSPNLEINDKRTFDIRFNKLFSETKGFSFFSEMRFI